MTTLRVFRVKCGCGKVATVDALDGRILCQDCFDRCFVVGNYNKEEKT